VVTGLAPGIGFGGHGLIMLAVPAIWYTNVPGVVDTGPFNGHFVRDVGATYVVCGTALLWPAARPAARIRAAFLALHALAHLWDAAAGREAATSCSSGAMRLTARDRCCRCDRPCRTAHA
jgi:hypothetical protein